MSNAADNFSRVLASFLQGVVDGGTIPLGEMAEILSSYAEELEFLAYASEVEDKLVAKQLRNAGRLT